ncbi:hypothetical protein LMG7974_00178 [Campylobacter majalis]|uniref:ABC transmembrane type-1 domain-containing protein n=1 Tax=Campylobacter majalis TaxID=2790656 RepID=A0ABM8Q2D7_9BACT|nr:ABC transporter six-transmembrane domain-containing protein [Campylobacter majalis]CAD7286973.1 hypothetical protein LMG7974_00178 [Campylobacter majalis]
MHTKSAFNTLKTMAKQNYKKLIITFGLVLLENLLILAYPLIAGFAINKIMQGDIKSAMIYAIMAFVFWGVGALRRMIDTMVFTKIYTSLVTKVITNQRNTDNFDASTTTAHVALSREFIKFFEEHLPMFFTSVISIIGACFMLLVLEFYVGLTCVLVLVIVFANIKKFSKINEGLFNRLNSRMERDVDVITASSEYQIARHYAFTSLLRISISNKEAFGYFIHGIFAFFIFSVAIVSLCLGEIDAGHIYAVFSYSYSFMISLDDTPTIVQKYSQLKDIDTRVDTNDNNYVI